MMRVCKFIFVILLVLFVSIAKAESQKLQFKKLNVKSGLNSNVVYSLLQDSRGFIWLGTKEGINRFDGYKMITYSLPAEFNNKIADHRIRALCEDSNGLIWMGTPNGVVQLDPYSGEVKHFLLPFEAKGAQSLYVNDMIVTEDNNIWVGTRNGLYQFNHIDGKFNHYEHFPYTNKTLSYSKGERFIKDLCIAEDGKLWIGTAGNGITILDILKKKEANFSSTCCTHER